MPLFGPVLGLRGKRQSLENGMQSTWNQVQKRMLKKVREERGGLGGVRSGGAVANKLLSSWTSRPVAHSDGQWRHFPA